MSLTDPLDELPDSLGDQIGAIGGDYHDRVFGEYHPSSLSGCPLGTFLDFMTEKQVTQNNYMFSGSAVHYYLQEHGVLNRALHTIGYHHLSVSHEVSTRHQVTDDVEIIGSCDTIARGNGEKIVIDLKYTSLKPHYKNGRITKYAAQVNTYANMLGADRWCLLFLDRNGDDMTDAANIMAGETNGEVWDVITKRARNIHSALDHFGYPEGERWDVEILKNKDVEFWEEVMQFFDEDDVPSYKEELKYSDRDEWVLPYQDNWRSSEDTSGLMSFKS